MQLNNRLISLDEVAKYLGLSRWSIYRLIESGRLTAYKVGRFWRFKAEDIQAYLERKRVNIPRRVFRPQVLVRYHQDPKNYLIIKRGPIGWLKLSRHKVSGLKIRYERIILPDGKSAIQVLPKHFKLLPEADQKEWLKFEIH